MFHTSNETILLIGLTNLVDFVLTRTDLAFNNSLDHRDCLGWRTPRDGLAGN